MESEEYMNRKQQEAEKKDEVSILLLLLLLITIITRHSNQSILESKIQQYVPPINTGSFIL